MRKICGRRTNDVNAAVAVVYPARIAESFLNRIDLLLDPKGEAYVISNSDKICFSLSTSKNSVCAICLEEFLDKKMNV